MNLPAEFEERMERLLGEEYPRFRKCFAEGKKQGIRVNTAKISVEEFLRITPFKLTPVPWVKNGFFYRDEDAVTRHPHYFAGLYYVQEPSAMVPASRLPVQPGERVLDLCAAPGGKTTELGARLAGQGVLVANDISVSRAGGLLKNVELFGISNAFVTAEEPAKLSMVFPEYFDKILVDAPCSGEGMFRKDPALIKSWLRQGPSFYAPLQRQIVSEAVKMLRPGGMLLYSTCTFSPEEDEETISALLEEYPDLTMEHPESYEGFCGGLLRQDSPERRFENEKCIRIWPHHMDGEGHFAALLKKRGENGSLPASEELCEFREVDGAGDIPKEAVEFLEKIRGLYRRGQKFVQKKELLFLLPEQFPIHRLRYLRTGLLLGTMKKNRFEPSQALAMALGSDGFANIINYASKDPGVYRYLKGETPELPQGGGTEEEDLCRPGWVLVCCDGYPLGWGKWVNGTLRNKYCPGWRMM